MYCVPSRLTACVTRDCVVHNGTAVALLIYIHDEACQGLVLRPNVITAITLPD